MDPKSQSSGIGSKLVKFALEHMRSEWKCTECEIWVLEGRAEILAWSVPFAKGKLLAKCLIAGMKASLGSREFKVRKAGNHSVR